MEYNLQIKIEYILQIKMEYYLQLKMEYNLQVKMEMKLNSIFCKYLSIMPHLMKTTFLINIIQVNIIIGTIIASFLPIGAISHLYYADRLNQLPLAIFGIALGVVLLPGLSKAIKSDNNEMTKNSLKNLKITTDKVA